MPQELPTTVELLTAPNLAQAEGLVHGFSTRTGGVSTVYRQAGEQSGSPSGDLNLGYTPHDDPAQVRQNRARFLHSLNATGFRNFGLLRQEHTADIRVISSLNQAMQDFLPPATLPGDGLMTDLPGVLLTIQTADCIPVLLYDPIHRAIAAFHAGWRGTLARIVQHGTAAMRLHYGSNPSELQAAIGPGIGPQSYAVSQDIQQQFASEFTYTDALFHSAGDTGQLHLDLWEANRQQLLSAGLNPANIEVLAHDTATDTARFFSHRAERGFTGRMMSAIALT